MLPAGRRSREAQKYAELQVPRGKDSGAKGAQNSSSGSNSRVSYITKCRFTQKYTKAPKNGKTSTMSTQSGFMTLSLKRVLRMSETAHIQKMMTKAEKVTAMMAFTEC